jgi:signal transduction histidine kinase
VRSYLDRFAAAPPESQLGRRTRAIVGLRKDGGEFPLEAAISKLQTHDELMFTIVMRDMTYHATLEAELRKAVAARDEVMGIVAHDLRNPLATAMLTADLLVRPENERRVHSRQLAERLTRALVRATRLIEDLLDVTRLESGSGISIVPRPQLLPALAREAFDMLEPAAAAASVVLEARIAPDLPSVLVDETRIVQVLGNLIGNAVKFTPRGGLVRLSATRHGDELCVTVADTGKGMAAEHLEHMFDRFWQASPNDRRQGTGLGLAIAKGIVEAHGGRIWAESELGRGLAVTFTLPVAPPRGAKATWMPP